MKLSLKGVAGCAHGPPVKSAMKGVAFGNREFKFCSTNQNPVECSVSIMSDL